MYKNQLQELAQRSCFNLPSYICIREGPDHAPRFKAIVNFNGESFESPHYCSTLRQAEHAAAEVALNSLSTRGPSHSLAARILDETGVYKNLLQEISQRVAAPLPRYSTFRSGLGHQPVFTGTVELAGIIFTGEPAKNKKQAEKNAALAAWTSLKQLAQESANSSSEVECTDELEQVTVARALLKFRLKEKMTNPRNDPIVFPQKYPVQTTPRPPSPQRPAATTSKILPFICPKTPHRLRPPPRPPTSGDSSTPPRFPVAGAAPYVPLRYSRVPCYRIAPPVTVRNTMPVYSAPPRVPVPFPPTMRAPVPPLVQVAPPVCIRPITPAFAVPSVQKDSPSSIHKEDSPTVQENLTLVKEESSLSLDHKNVRADKTDPTGTEIGELKEEVVVASKEHVEATEKEGKDVDEAVNLQQLNI
ncbi:Double-stranded RNA-binding protein 2 [Dionaea muscipula]